MAQNNTKTHTISIWTTHGKQITVPAGKSTLEKLQSDAATKEMVQTLLSKRLNIDKEYIIVYPICIVNTETDEKEKETTKEDAVELPFMVDILEHIRTLRQVDMFKIVYGATFFASGGGGSLQMGLGLT